LGIGSGIFAGGRKGDKKPRSSLGFLSEMEKDHEQDQNARERAAQRPGQNAGKEKCAQTPTAN